MWTTGASHMIARLTGSTLFSNHNLLSTLTSDHRSISTTNDETSSSLDNVAKTYQKIAKMRDLRARGPYALFVQDNYRDISAKYPDLKLVEISRKAAEVWKGLSDQKKQDYAARFQAQKVIYEKEKQSLSPDDLHSIDADEKARRIEQQIRKRIQDLPTKKPRSSYAHFLMAMDRGDKDLRVYMKDVSRIWSQMSAEDKQKYEELYHEERQKYIKDLFAWATANDQSLSQRSSRSSSMVSSTTKDVPVEKTRGTSATGKRKVKKRTSASSKTAVSARKSTETKSSKSKTDKDTSSDDESSSKTIKSSKSIDSITS